VPAGDVLPGDGPRTSPTREAVTDGEGWIEFAPPRRTHTRLVLPEGLRAPQGEWVPDTCARVEIALPVRGRSLATVAFPAGEEPPKRLPADLRWPPGAAPEPSPVAPPWARPTSRLLFLLEGSAPLADRTLARYGAWVRSDFPRAATLEVSSGGLRSAHEVSLSRGADTRIDLPAP